MAGRDQLLPHCAEYSWTTTPDVVGKTFAWEEFDTSGATANTFSGTIAEMVDHVGSDHGGLIGLGFGCTHPNFFHFDQAQFGITDDVLTLDLEGPLTRTTIRGSATTVVAGSPVQLRGLTTEVGGTFLPQGTLTLQARRFDSPTWRDAGTAVETFDTTLHRALLKRWPLVKTDYRWVFAENAMYDGSRSGAFTVRVHPAVTAKPADATVRKGSTIKITGRVTPAKPGAVVTLLEGSTTVGSAVVRSTGTYTVTTKARARGVRKLHVAIGASAGNLAGASRIVKVTVS